MTPGGIQGYAARPPKSRRPTGPLQQTYPANVARQLLRGPWYDPRPSHPRYPQMRHPADKSLRQAAKVLLPPGVPGTGLTRPGHCLAGDILQSCRPPGFRGALPPEAESQDANALCLSQLHHREAAAAPPHAHKAS